MILTISLIGRMMKSVEQPMHGFALHGSINAVTRPWEPIYSRAGEDGMTTLAIWVRESHCNNQGILHGDVLAALADNALGSACARNLPADAFTRTIGLQIDYMGAVPCGSWLEIKPRVLKTGRSIVFANAHIFSGDQLVAMVSATFSIRFGIKEIDSTCNVQKGDHAISVRKGNEVSTAS